MLALLRRPKAQWAAVADEVEAAGSALRVLQGGTDGQQGLFGESPDVEDAVRAPIFHYLVKPVEFDALLELIRRLNLYWVMTNHGPELASAREL